MPLLSQIFKLVGLGEESSLIVSLFSIYQSIFVEWKIKEVFRVRGVGGWGTSHVAMRLA